MANRNRGEVEIEIGGEKRVLRLTTNALATLEGMHRKSMAEILASPGLSVLRDIIFVGLKAGDSRAREIRNLTPEKVGDWMDDREEGQMLAWAEVIHQALEAAMGKADDGDPGPLKVSGPASSTGTS
jgi:hypothetical protein